MEPVQQGVFFILELDPSYNLHNMLSRAVSTGLDVHDFSLLDNMQNPFLSNGLTKSYILGLDRIRNALGHRHPRTTFTSVEDNPRILLDHLHALNDPDILTAPPFATLNDRRLSRTLNFLKLDFFDAVQTLQLAVATMNLEARVRSCTPEIESVSLMNEIDAHRSLIRDKLMSGDIINPKVHTEIKHRISPRVASVESIVQNLVGRIVADQLRRITKESAQVDEAERLVVSLQSAIKKHRLSPAGAFLLKTLDGQKTPTGPGAGSDPAKRMNAEIERILSPPLPDTEEEPTAFISPASANPGLHLGRQEDELGIDFSDLRVAAPLEVIEDDLSNGGSLPSSLEDLSRYSDL